MDGHQPPRRSAQRRCGQAVERWINNYGQRCWLRQLTPYATREQEDELLRVIARMDGTPFPTTARLTGRWFRGRVPTASDWTRASRSWTSGFANRRSASKADERKVGWKPPTAPRPSPSPTRRWGLLTTEKHTNWFDPGKFWSGDTLPLARGIPAERRDRRRPRLGRASSADALTSWDAPDERLLRQPRGSGRRHAQCHRRVLDVHDGGRRIDGVCDSLRGLLRGQQAGPGQAVRSAHRRGRPHGPAVDAREIVAISRCRVGSRSW